MQTLKEQIKALADIINSKIVFTHVTTFNLNKINKPNDSPLNYQKHSLLLNQNVFKKN